VKTLGENNIWSFFDSKKRAQRIERATTVRQASGHTVKSFLELATKVAELQFRNPDFVLMFRGQNGDHRNSKGNTTLKPSLFRSKPGSVLPPEMGTLTTRYQALVRAEGHLVKEYNRAAMLGVDRLQRHRILRWAILQHYEVCPTPLLDITHSLRIAASFASQKAVDPAFLFVLAIPNLSGAITASAEAGLQIIRLASVCPPSAVRPHIQEGYLLGEYPDLANFDQKELYAHYEIDFGRRLVAKFRFNPTTFWKSDTFPKVAQEALYPPESKDPLYKLALRVKTLANC
jgi:hypothetical protein